MLIRLKRDERGMALVVSMLVVFVVLILSTVVVAKAISSSGTSGYDRRRLQSVNAAEAGINWAFSEIQSTDVEALSCQPTTQTLDTGPGSATFTSTPTFFDASGNVLPCPDSDPTPFNDNYFPAAVMIESSGETGNGAVRTMQTYMQLTPLRSGFRAAIVANGSGGLTLSNNMTLNGDSANDADIFVNNGPLVISNQPNVYGSVYVGGGCATPSICTTTMSNNSKVWGNLWSAGTVTMNNPSSVVGNVTSSVGDIQGTGSIGGNATAAGTIASSVNVSGTKSPNTTSPLPPTQAFPQIRWNQTEWESAGYTVTRFTDAATAKAFIMSAPAGDNVVWLDCDPCALSFVNNDRIDVMGNLAIVTRSSISMSQRVEWTGVGGTHNLHFISVWQDSLSYPSACSTSPGYNVGDSNNVYYSSVNVSFYSPCTVSINNRSSMSGQVLGGTVQINNAFTMNFEPVLIPGYGNIDGFEQDIVYIREVRSD